MEFLSCFDKSIAPGFLEGTFEPVCDTSRYEWNGRIGAKLDPVVVVGVVVVVVVVAAVVVIGVVEWKDGK